MSIHRFGVDQMTASPIAQLITVTIVDNVRNKYQKRKEPWLKKEMYFSQLRCSMSKEIKQHCPIISSISGSLILNCYRTDRICAYRIMPSPTYSQRSSSSRLIVFQQTTVLIFSSMAISSSSSKGVYSGMNSLRWLQKVSTPTDGQISDYYYLQSLMKMYRCISQISYTFRKNGQTYSNSAISFCVIVELFRSSSCIWMSANCILSTRHRAPIVFLIIYKSASFEGLKLLNSFLSFLPETLVSAMLQFLAPIFRTDFAKLSFRLSIQALIFSLLTLYLDQEVEDFLRVGLWKTLRAFRMLSLKICQSIEHLLRVEYSQLLLEWISPLSLNSFGLRTKLLVFLLFLTILLISKSSISFSQFNLEDQSSLDDSVCLGQNSVGGLLQTIEICSTIDDFLEIVFLYEGSFTEEPLLLSFYIYLSLQFSEQFRSFTYSLSIQFCSFRFYISFRRFSINISWFFVYFQLSISFSYFSSSFVTLYLEPFIESFGSNEFIKFWFYFFSCSSSLTVFYKLLTFQWSIWLCYCHFYIYERQYCDSLSYLAITYLKCMFQLLIFLRDFSYSKIKS